MLCLQRCSFCALVCMWGASAEVKNIAFKQKHCGTFSATHAAVVPNTLNTVKASLSARLPKAGQHCSKQRSTVRTATRPSRPLLHSRSRRSVTFVWPSPSTSPSGPPPNAARSWRRSDTCTLTVQSPLIALQTAGARCGVGDTRSARHFRRRVNDHPSVRAFSAADSCDCAAATPTETGRAEVR